ncbi:MAG: 23S rRNA (guanosine(2251)-2'-O)-methyltransferase RlmB [Bacteroidales bacterium]|nr:23S rRNA (guanosine(2251)-2'-O)-methyltransferase RlmB [Bacteroidales bacterium]
MSKFIFGIHPVIEAIKNGVEINKILIRKGLRSDAIGQLINMAKPFNIPVQFIPIERLNKFTRKNHQGVLAIVSPVEYQPWNEILNRVFADGKDPLFLVLDGITDVRNFGAIARTAECAAVDCIIISTTNNPGITADAVKTSAGALNSIPVSRVKNLPQTIEELKNSGLNIVACTSSQAKNYTQHDYTQPLAIIMGSEDKGIDKENLKFADQKVGIPILGQLDSLNVSVATGIVLYEVLRQRK